MTFIAWLVEEFRQNGANWENNRLDSYLEGIESWTGDMEGYYENTNVPIPDSPSWRVMADILLAATMYD